MSGAIVIRYTAFLVGGTALRIPRHIISCYSIAHVMASVVESASDLPFYVRERYIDKIGEDDPAPVGDAARGFAGHACTHACLQV